MTTQPVSAPFPPRASETPETWFARASAKGWWLAIELLLIVAWACWVGRDFLDLDPMVWPGGGEFGMVLQSHFAWEQYASSGLGLFWNGASNGGHPAFVDLHGAVLHPVVIVSTLLTGAINGAKLTVVGSLIMAGLAQWWMARTLKLGSVPRLWSAALAVAGGHMAGRLQAGLFPLMLSTASASLVLAASLYLAFKPNGRRAAILGLMLALTMVSGQAYVQIGMLMSYVPAWLILVLDRRLRLRPGWGRFVLACVVGVLLCAAFWVPMAHHWPAMYKWMDPDLKSVPPLAYLPFNLVISDADFFRGEALGKQRYAFLYVNYIGWLAVGLAGAALRLVPREGRRWLGYLVACAALGLLAASVWPYKAVAYFAAEAVSGIRNPSVSSSLAVPPILALAAWGLDRILGWRGLRLSLDLGDRPKTLNLFGLLFLLPLVFSAQNAADFGTNWMGTARVKDDAPRAVQSLEVDGAEWVCAPFGKHIWNPHLMSAGFKVTDVVLPWRWKDRDNPPPSVGLCYEGDEPPAEEGAITAPIGDGMVLLEWPDRHYASLTSGERVTPVRAEAHGGHIAVRFQTEAQATLTVQEHAVSGWQATLDGQPLYMLDGPWLSALVPPGEHEVVFEYLPLDVWVGLGISALGALVALGLILAGGKVAGRE